MTRYIPEGRDDLWRRQAEANAEEDRLDKAIVRSGFQRADLARALGDDDPLVDDLDADIDRMWTERAGAASVANRIHAERTAGLSFWIDESPHLPICSACGGTGGPRLAGGGIEDARTSCRTCRGWGREDDGRGNLPVWHDGSDGRGAGWFDPATGRQVEVPDPTREPPTTEPPKETAMRTPEPGTPEWDALLHAVLNSNTADKKGWTAKLAEHNDNRDDQGRDRTIKDMAERSRPTTTGGAPDLQDLRVGRWYDENPITSTNTGSTGGTMANIEEARAAIMAGIEKENEALGAAQHARASLEEAQNMLLQGTQGSNQAEADQAHAQLTDAISKIDEASQQVASTLQEFQSVADRL